MFGHFIRAKHFPGSQSFVRATATSPPRRSMLIVCNPQLGFFTVRSGMTSPSLPKVAHLRAPLGNLLPSRKISLCIVPTCAGVVTKLWLGERFCCVANSRCCPVSLALAVSAHQQVAEWVEPSASCHEDYGAAEELKLFSRLDRFIEHELALAARHRVGGGNCVVAHSGWEMILGHLASAQRCAPRSQSRELVAKENPALYSRGRVIWRRSGLSAWR